MSIEAQLQIRQNAHEIQGYLKDLFAWEEEVKAKEKKLKKKQDGQEAMPGPRGRAAGSVHAAPAELQKPGLDPKTGKKDAAGTSKLPGVPAASGGMQLPNKSTQAEEQLLTAVSSTRLQPQADAAGTASSSAQEHVLPPVRNTATGPLLLARGNEHFKLGDHKSAEECYTRSLELEPSSLAFANRAMAMLKLGRHAEAEADCSEALRMDPKYAKAWLRRGAARRALGMPLEAACDFEEAVRLEPMNKAAIIDRDGCLAEHMAAHKLSTLSAHIPLSVQLSTFVPRLAPQHAGTTVSAPSQQLGTSLAAAAAAAAAAGSAGKDSAVAATSEGTKTAAHLHTAGHASASSASTAGTNGVSSIAPSVSESNRRITSNAGALTPGGSEPASTSIANDSGSPNRLAAYAASIAAAAAAATAGASATAKPPSSAAEFEASWRKISSLQGDDALAARCAMLRSLSPDKLPQVFKAALTAPLLTSIVTATLQGMVSRSNGGSNGSSREVSAEVGETVGQQGMGMAAMPAEHGVSLLEGMAKVDRFMITCMSVSSKERSALSAAWSAAEVALSAASSPALSGLGGRLTALRSVYRVS